MWLAAITAVRGLVNEPALALSFLSVFAIGAAAYRFGRKGMLVVAAASTALFVADEVLIRSEALEATSKLLLATGSRVVVFFGVGFMITELLRRQDRLSRQLAEREWQMGELTSIRDALIPRALPQLSGMEAATAYAPAERGVAGDFFVVVPSVDQSVLMVLGDVMGHGLDAARRAAFVRATLTNFASFSSDPGELLRLTNAAIYDRDSNIVEFVTATCVRVWPDTGDIAWAQAGHPPPLDLDTGDPLHGWHACAPLGIDETLACSTRHVRLDAGQGFLLFSDGLIEARPPRPGAELFGDERVRDVLIRHQGRSPADIVAALRDAAIAYAEGELADDLTLLASRLELVRSSRLTSAFDASAAARSPRL